MKSLEILNGMTPDELLAEKVAIDAQIEQLREQKRTIARIEDQKLAEQAAAARIANLSDPEKQALAQTLQAEGFVAGSM